MLLVAEPILGQEEKAALCDVIDAGWITMGDRVRAFEQAFAAAHAAHDAVAVSSCTAALHLILHALGVGPGDEVLVPSLTFVATANAVLYVGATPVFVDIESLDMPVMSRIDAMAKCTDKTRAVILMHYAGYLVDCEAWRAFADRHGLVLIEDAAHAAGAPDAGTFGHAAAFSLYGNKNMTSAEGGVILSPDPGLLDRVRQMRSHGMTSTTFQRHSSRNITYDVTMLGYNYRMDELRAAIGLAQLNHLEQWNEKRERLTYSYRQALRERCPAVSLPFANWQASNRRTSAYHIMPVLLPDGIARQVVVDRLRDAQIQTSNHYPPVHRFALYQERFPSVALPKTEAFSSRQLTLPLHPRIEDWHVRNVVEGLAKALA